MKNNWRKEVVWMRICRAENYTDMCRKAANIISAQVIMKPNCVLGLATGATPLGIYEQLVSWYQKGDLDFSQVTSINLDEYKGISTENEQSYYRYMHDHFFDRINISMDNTYLPNGMEQDAEKACTYYNAVIRRTGGIDLQLLGLGHNGHIGFNEPGVAFEKETHCVRLSQSTIEANRHFFEREEVPKQAYTMGMKSIMQAKKIVLAVSGRTKAEILMCALYGPVTPEVPASILQLHNDVTIVADQDALCSIDTIK